MIVDLNKYKGIVVSAKANYLNVVIDIPDNQSICNINSKLKNIRLLCTRRSKLKYQGHSVIVGDNVLVENVDWNQKKAVVCEVHNRITWIERPPVANATNIIILFSVSQPSFDFDQVNRFLVTAEKTNLEVSLVLNKCDLISTHQIHKYTKQLKDWGYNPIIISIKNAQGLDLLLAKIKSFKLSVLCGPSGVGKSSLINFLLPKKSLAVSAVSKKLQRGRHTTRNVELFSLDKDCLIADSPGFNRPDIAIEPIKLPYLFPEIRSQIELKGNSCKFRDCLHRDEPGCVIEKDWQRYSFYRECLEEMIILHRQAQEG